MAIGLVEESKKDRMLVSPKTSFTYKIIFLENVEIGGCNEVLKGVNLNMLDGDNIVVVMEVSVNENLLQFCSENFESVNTFEEDKAIDTT